MRPRVSSDPRHPGRLRRALRKALHTLAGRGSPVGFLSEEPRYSRFEVGAWSYGEPEVIYWDAGARLRIGRFCSIASGVTILLGGEHHTEWVSSYPFSLIFPEAASLPGYPYTKGDVVIGNDVWIGRNALLLSGITVGDGAVIGAGSVVSRDVEPYSIAAGNPARHVRYRFPAETIEALRRIAWWHWPLADVKQAWPALQSGDVEAFVERYAKTTPAR